MNERIKELIEQANTEISYRVDPHSFKQIDDPNGPHTRLEFSKEKFAELIVNECLRIVDDEGCGEGGSIRATEKIKEHFGVEE